MRAGGSRECVLCGWQAHSLKSVAEPGIREFDHPRTAAPGFRKHIVRIAVAACSRERRLRPLGLRAEEGVHRLLCVSNPSAGITEPAEYSNTRSLKRTGALAREWKSD